MWSILYNIFVVPLFYFVFIAGSVFNSKMRAGLKGRIGTIRKLSAFIKEQVSGKEIIFFHSASLGEWEQAVPLIEGFKAKSDSYIYIASFFSPSGYNAVPDSFIDYKLYLPFDGWFTARRLFKVLKPKLWIISKYDVWPNLIIEARKRDIPIILSSAELADDSKRFKGILKYFNKNIYNRLDAIFCVSDSHKRNFDKIYSGESLLAYGDTRYERIFQKAQTIMSQSKFDLFNGEYNIFIAGSIWAEDQKVILPSLFRVKREFPTLKIILVPHEIHEHTINNLIAEIELNNLSVVKMTELIDGEKTDADIVIVDKIGVLAALYRISTIAYVGGSFSSGVHNVMEPAAFYQPVIFGPKHINSFEATELIRLQGGFTISNSEEFYTVLVELLKNKELLSSSGNIAGNFLQRNQGATEKILRYLDNKYSI